MTHLSETVAGAADRLTEAGIPTARADAELLMAHVLEVGRGELMLTDALSSVHVVTYESLVSERARRVPLQHLTGNVGFRHISLDVGPGVFVPRPETEALVSRGLERIAPLSRPVVVDLCAGSGAISLAVASERPDAVVHAVEKDKHAYAWLERNAQLRQEAGDTPIVLRHADATSPAVLKRCDGAVDLVLSNPPYIPVGSTVAPEVHHDPAAALWGGADGLDVVRGIVATAFRLLKPGGYFACEHGEQHAPAMREILLPSGIERPQWTSVEPYTDLTGRIRGTGAQKGV